MKDWIDRHYVLIGWAVIVGVVILYGFLNAKGCA